MTDFADELQPRTQEQIESYVQNVLAGMTQTGSLDVLLWQAFAKRSGTPAEFCRQLREMLKIIEDAGGCS